MTKGGLRSGDALVLTKPLGFGVTTTAIKRELTSAEETDEVIGWMSRLNAKAGALANEFGLRGATDITGFSLLGHAHEMAAASGVGLRFWFDKMPFISCAMKFAEQWSFPGGSSDNMLHFGQFVRFAAGIDETRQMLLFDAQTSGGLLLGVPQEKLSAFLARAAEMDQPAWLVGEVVAGEGIDVLGEKPW
jgi:selenide,water dikinase